MRGYGRWFGVDLACAVKELRMLGVELDPECVARLEETLRHRKPRRQRKLVEEDPMFVDDGVPFVVRWARSLDPPSDEGPERRNDEAAWCEREPEDGVPGWKNGVVPHFSTG